MRAVGSEVERCFDIAEVEGALPSRPTILNCCGKFYWLKVITEPDLGICSW
jgi:hypothetical protein